MNNLFYLFRKRCYKVIFGKNNIGNFKVCVYNEIWDICCKLVIFTR